MKESLHYLLMSDHLMVQKALLNRIKDTGLTSGQPKILDYLMHHDGAIQKEIAVFCHIEPASLTVILNGMENKGYITRQTDNGNRRALHVYLTPSAENMPAGYSRNLQKLKRICWKGFRHRSAKNFKIF